MSVRPEGAESGAERPAQRAEGESVQTSFVEQFVEGWALPKPEGFIDYFGSRIHPGAPQTLPPLRTVYGPEGQARFFRRYFALVPDATATVVGSAEDGEWTFIRFRVEGHLGGKRPVAFEGIDHFRLVDGKIAARDTWVNAVPILAQVVFVPSAWIRALAFTLGR